MHRTAFSILLVVLTTLSGSAAALACSFCTIACQNSCSPYGDPAHYGSGDADPPLDAYRIQNNGWSFTASGFSPSRAPAVVTWSIVPNGTTLPTGVGEPSSPSNLIAFLDGVHHGGPGPGRNDLTHRAWFPLFESSFQRWSDLSGVTFVYESNDDGNPMPGFAGALGVRGDTRIGGHSIDGQTSPTILAYAYYPNTGDIVIDTDEINRWSNSHNNYLLFRNTLMHEIGHVLGLQHVSSSSSRFLMEPNLSSAFDGPQFDDILGAHRLYGDRNEAGLGNGIPSRATPLGPLSFNNPIVIGADATSTVISPTATDFVSIHHLGDIDFYRFSVSGPTTVDILLTPIGPTYQEGIGGATAAQQTTFIASNQVDLTLELFDSTGFNSLGFANNGGLGFAEQLVGMALPSAGDYFVKVAGLNDSAQFYRLDITMVPEPTSLVLLAVCLAALSVNQRRWSRFVA